MKSNLVDDLDNMRKAVQSCEEAWQFLRFMLPYSEIEVLVEMNIVHSIVDSYFVPTRPQDILYAVAKLTDDFQTQFDQSIAEYLIVDFFWNWLNFHPKRDAISCELSVLRIDMRGFYFSSLTPSLPGESNTAFLDKFQRFWFYSKIDKVMYRIEKRVIPIDDSY